jgi:hypothetical protein
MDLIRHDATGNPTFERVPDRAAGFRDRYCRCCVTGQLTEVSPDSTDLVVVAIAYASRRPGCRRARISTEPE